jgi:hypothetical protein
MGSEARSAAAVGAAVPDIGQEDGVDAAPHFHRRSRFWRLVNQDGGSELTVGVHADHHCAVRE